MSFDVEPYNTFYLSYKIGLLRAINWVPYRLLLPKVEYKIKQHDDIIIIYGKSPYYLEEEYIRDHLAKYELLDCSIENHNNNRIRCSQLCYLRDGSSLNRRSKLIAAMIFIEKDLKNKHSIPPKLVKITYGSKTFNKQTVHQTDYRTIFVVDLEGCRAEENEKIHWETINNIYLHAYYFWVYWSEM